MATECWDCGDKAGFITLWPNDITRDKDFKRADEIRDELLAQGVEIKDGPEGTTWQWSV